MEPKAKADSSPDATKTGIDPGNSSGANTDRSRSGSSRAFSLAKTTWNTRAGADGEVALDVDGAFANVMRFGDRLIGMTSDGIGTKIEVAERTGLYRSLGWDLAAMAVDDLAAVGLEPTSLSNIIDVNRIEPETIEELMLGLAEAASFARVAVTGGEIAELGDRISGYGPGMHFNWCATAIGVLPQGASMIDGRSVIPGDAVVSIGETGFRSNGFSVVRAVLAEAFGPEWHDAPFAPGKSWGEAVLEPSRIYCRAVIALQSAGLDLHAVAHVTGGGIPGNLGRVLKLTGLSAELDSLFPPGDVVEGVRRLGRLKLEAAYQNWNMGNGMLIVLPRGEAEKSCDIISSYGFEARTAGRITASGPDGRTVTIVPAGALAAELPTGALAFVRPEK
jgi:phosphoribosylformylglycinamidine cyclo-ligase